MTSLIAVDTGGTFTDLVSYDASTRLVRRTKSLTTHSKPLEGVLTCVAKEGLSLGETRMFKFGTTLVINTLLERDGARVALLTTRGFKDVLSFSRGYRLDTFDLSFRSDGPLVSPQLRFELNERMDARGVALARPEKEEVAAIAAGIARTDATAVAVSFLNSYVRADHEEMVADWLRELLPDHFICSGAALSQEWYEYERTSTAAANAYCGPKVGRFIGRFESTLRDEGFDGTLLFMGSNGGVLSPQTAATAPVALVESGPVGGCIGAARFSARLGIDLIAFDMGGTTAKCCLVRNGAFDIESTFHAGGYIKGVPIRTPVLDIIEVGAGGGSIAWVDPQGLHVGPVSAGSTPGPACYGRGGERPTVTDANLVLGRLNPGNFQGGEMTLDLDLAENALHALGQELQFADPKDTERLASGILEIAAATMAGAIRRVTVQRGHDPSGFTLFAYGGGGPLHSVELARELGIKRVMIPPEAGNFSAIGMLLADVRNDDARTFLKPLDADTVEQCERVLRKIEENLTARMKLEFPGAPIRTERHADMRYQGQHHTIRIELSRMDEPAIDQQFRAAYSDRYGHAMQATPIEFVVLRVVGFAEIDKPEIDMLSPALSGTGAGAPTQREVFFPGVARRVMTNVYQRADLPRGFHAAGPAIIEEYGSTTALGPHDRFTIGSYGEIAIDVATGQGVAA